MSSDFYVLSGGPGAGKTSVLTALRARGMAVVPEVARDIIREQRSIGGNAHHEGDRALYLELQLSRSLLTYKLAKRTDVTRPVVFDRGLVDLVGYCGLIGMEVPAHLARAVEQYLYNPRVFLFPPWREIYENDAARGQSFSEAERTFDAIWEAYRACGYDYVLVPQSSVEERVAFISGHLTSDKTRDFAS